MFNDYNQSAGFLQPGVGPEPSTGTGASFNKRPSAEVRKSKVFCPVTNEIIRRALPRPDDICEFLGDAINDIILVGRLIRRLEEPMRTHFEINDNTGTQSVIFYHKGEN